MMRHAFPLILLLLSLLLFAGCAAYKELSPDPPMVPLELGYIPLKDGDENFSLEKGNKYFLQIPGTGKDQFYLVLTTDKKWAIDPLLARFFDDKDGPGERIPDEGTDSDSMMVYPVDATAPTYFWVIESVKADIDLTLRYRFVPRWRFTFEHRYVEYRQAFEQHRSDRTVFNAIDEQFPLHTLNVAGERSALEKNTAGIITLSDALKKLEGLFPPDLRVSRDTAYQRLVQLKGEVSDELDFQRAYASVLTAFERLQETRGNSGTFLASAPAFVEFLQNKQIPPRIANRTRRDIAARLPETFRHYDNQLRAKTDLTAITLTPPLGPVQSLHEACGVPFPAEFATLTTFVDAFNAESDGVRKSAPSLRSLEQAPVSETTLLSDSVYAGMILTASTAVQMLPKESGLTAFERFRDYPCAVALRKEMTSAIGRAAGFHRLYNTARIMASSVSLRDWTTSESLLREMDTDAQFGPFPAVERQQNSLVGQFESRIVKGVLAASTSRAEAFAARNQTVIENVQQLYADSSFTPVYTLTYSSGGTAEAARNRQAIQNELDQVRYYRFPDGAIRVLYRMLSENAAEQGVEKARAIVAHGREYKGTDPQIKAYVNECDATVPKAIVRAKEYRRMLALPVTDSRGGSNEYLFRVLLQIPSDAQFPVFDVNIRLPGEVARNAGAEPWYSSITINKTPIRNEGRFRITAPTAANGFESMITPVQMDKAGRNILEVRFTYPGFGVFEVSAMAQVPIIRKN